MLPLCKQTFVLSTMRKTWILILLIIAALIAIKKIFLPPVDTSAPGGPGGKTPPVGVNVITVHPVPLDETINTTGTLAANEEVELRAELAGRITHLDFKEGSNVTKGQLLAKVNDAELQAQLNKINLAIKLAEQKVERNKKLLQIQGISQEEYDVLQNELESLKADRDVLRSQIDKSEIRAPFSGTIGLRSVSEGAFVTNQQLIATLRQIQPVKIDFSVSENYIGRIKNGDLLRFSIANSNLMYEGRIYAIEPSVDAATRSIRVRALASGDASSLLPGAFTKIKITLQPDNALMVPTQAVVPVLKGKQLFVARDGKADTVSIITGIRNDTAIQVLSGLQAGDTVITTGLMQLRPGNDIKIKPGK